ncbi:MAG: hypothetical protein Q4G33_11855 [bacterium]|nr:hypothetical protein [bacterium]
MTDERLEQILKQALSPEVSDAEIKIRAKERKYRMKKAIKAGIAAAACLALTVTAGLGSRYFGRDGADDIPKSDNSFTLTAYAEELTPDKDVPVVIGNMRSWGLEGYPDTGKVSYCIQTFFRCEGKDIESVTYSINKGAFKIVELPEKSIVADVKDYEEEINAGSIGGVRDENGNIITKERLATEYTVSYNMQTNDTTWFNICGEITSPDLFNTLCSGNSTQNPDAVAAGYDEMLEGVEITCTAHYTDGSSASKIIVGTGKVMTFREAGQYYDYEGFNPDEAEAFIVFELKEPLIN